MLDTLFEPAKPKLTLTLAETRVIWERVGGLSNPGKMPGFAWGISAHECKTGGKLRGKKNATCSICYALKGQYLFPNVVKAHQRRLVHLHSTQWVSDMVALLSVPEHYLYRLARKKSSESYDPVTWFRWLDSGDLQGVWHWVKIRQVVEATPWVQHWVPTREPFMHSKYPEIYPNVVVRHSPPFIDGMSSACHSSMVRSHENIPAGVYRCPAPEQGNSCGDCRECWNPATKIVSYKAH